jgi:arylsulfatase A-like enzyme
VKPNLLLIILLLLIASCTAKQQQPNQQQPNFIFILCDDLGYGDLTCYNPESEIKTPNINSLAGDGVRFTQHYSAGPLCSPSRRAFLTGRYQSRLGEWAESYAGLPTFDGVPADREPSIAMYLKKAGYKNGCFGKWNIGEVEGVSRPGAHGFDEYICIDHNTEYFYHRKWLGEEDLFRGERGLYGTGGKVLNRDGEYLPDIFTDAAIDFIRVNKGNPFFVYLPYAVPHEPMQGPEDKPASWKEAPGKKPKETTNRETYVKMVEYLDKRIGDLLQTLKDLKIEDNTIVIFSSDNGGMLLSNNTPLRAGKQHLFEGGIRVPMLVRWPNRLPEAKVVTQPTIIMDITSTFIELAQAGKYVPRGRVLDGKNLIPYILNEKTELREFGWRKRTRNHAVGVNFLNNEAYRYGDWKYVKVFEGASKKYTEYLFNLKNDVGESDNLKETNPERFDEMRTRFNDWKKETVNTKDPVYIPLGKDQYGSGR